MAPKMIRQREEYEMAVDQLLDYQHRLETALSERDDAAKEAAEARRAAVILQTRLAERQAESQDLAKQVQTLLVSRSNDGSATTTTAGVIPTSIQEMQSHNQSLMVEHRRLTQTVAELESKLQADTLKSKFDKASSELKSLQEERKEQEILVERIVQQRDLYRALLAKHDSNMLGSESDELTALEMAKQQSERAKKLEHQNKELEGDLKAVRAEMERVAGDKEAMSERLNRYEVQSAEYMKSIERLERDLLSARSDVARSNSESQYHKEKCERLESSLERVRGEIVHVNNAKNELQRINADLQQSVSNTHSESASLESAKRHAEMKLRLVETQLETAKSAEKRVTEENSQLRTEVVRQGVLIDSIRRIEASLSANNEGEKETLRKEKESLTQRLSEEASKHLTETENVTVRIQQLEARIQDLDSSKDKAHAEVLDAKKSLLALMTDKKKLTSKCNLLESQLRAAKKKLGESDDDGDQGEVAMQSKIDKLESELESAKAEIDSLKESSQNYQKVAKDSEKALADLQKVKKIK
jgi:chromosome segregation ATPase